ncbi:family 43 glycosylhydrolase [Prevotella sp. E2-28]|uniref:family 43 glycosylhydrolase n=1 Tax=Prevotella sp. E2-28 TaxID=2913620 RepID=UPI001EDB3D08|nr:family 43 glycosylhydrolase [Prevotella sp. E2-28]UKK54438.1 family 43 glycosylhydrolase [Prevotella sp. E2-28]
MKQTLTVLMLAVPLLATAQNPVIRDQFSADPTARVFNNKVYLYPSHDIMPPAGQRQDWFCMEDYHVFSSENLTDWTDHGIIVTQNKVPWVRKDSYSMWAPDCVERNGKYYFYFPSAPAGGRGGFAVGVAIADRPEGPFIPEPEPIKGINGIDPCVLQASDGNAYIFWGNGRCAKLKPNMKELADDNPKETVKWGNREMEMVGVNCLKDLPNRQAEGPFAFEYNGNYYLTYPYVREKTEVLGYAMSKNPMGPYEYKGLIMAEHANGCWTNHHSIVNYKGQWYLFYHQNFFSPNDDKRRSVQIEKLYFNADGTIQEVKPTMRGVGINKATEKIEIDRYSTASEGVTTAHVDTTIAFSGDYATIPSKGWMRYTDVDFSCLTDGYMQINVKASDDTEFCVREKDAKGKVIARIKLAVRPPEPTPGAAANPMMSRFRRDLRNQWLTQTATLEYKPTGVSDLVITNEGEGELSVDWILFKNRPKYFSPASATPATPDSEGFIRRWMLLEPIDKPNSGNTVFTDTYLREHFNREYFKGQQTILPKDGQKVKAVFQQEQAPAGFGRGAQQQVEGPQVKTVKQTLTWHALDSENFNIKLFRFAEKWGEKVYGVLFWGVTIIDCDEDIENVRLAVGSNSASMWWLNGEETLLLSGDRRMVKDDAVSRRVTLKKGRNILRGAIINGPGMSDFCVRFLDEKGNPVTNYSIINSK